MFFYFQIASGGIDINIASTLPSVSKPKRVPRSYNKLNSAYLPRLIFLLYFVIFCPFFSLYFE